MLIENIMPTCNKCDDCKYDYLIKSYRCEMLNNKRVGASVFGRNSPKYCPKRNKSK